MQAIAKGLSDPHLTRHKEMRADLHVIVDSADRCPREAAEAKLLLVKLEKQLARLAADVLLKTEGTVTKLADRGDYDAAVAELEAACGRFEGSEWFRTGGESRIGGLVKTIEERREASEFDAVGRARVLMRVGKLDEAREALADEENWSSDRARELAEELLKTIGSRGGR